MIEKIFFEGFQQNTEDFVKVEKKDKQQNNNYKKK